MELFDGRDVCVGPVNNFEEAFDDEQLHAREMIVASDVPGAGSWKHVGNPLKMTSNTGELVRRPPPRMGEHTDELLRELGLTDDAIRELRDAGTV